MIPASELHFEFLRSSGPGGQNVNKVATAVRLTFDVGRSTALTDEVKQRLLRLAGRRAGDDGIVAIVARRFRTQGQNRADAIERLQVLVRKASVPPKRRRPTRPTRASKERRLDTKRRESRKKRERRAVRDGGD